MSIKPIAKLAGRYHFTGLNADRKMARQVFELYCRFQSMAEQDILEIGPGHTVEVLEEALAAGAKSSTVSMWWSIFQPIKPLKGELPIGCTIHPLSRMAVESDEMEPKFVREPAQEVRVETIVP